jgi:hypothetical protein
MRLFVTGIGPDGRANMLLIVGCPLAVFSLLVENICCC